VGRINWEFGISRYKPLHIEWIKTRPYSIAGRLYSIYCSEAYGKEYANEYVCVCGCVCVCITEPLVCVPETNTIL